MRNGACSTHVRAAKYLLQDLGTERSTTVSFKGIQCERAPEVMVWSWVLVNTVIEFLGSIGGEFFD
jgi:hypothetical protein